MTSITVASDVKAELGSMKPPSLSWSRYLHLVVHSIDHQHLAHLLEEAMQEEYQESIRRARQRYDAALKDPDALLDHDDAMEHVRRLRGG